MSGRTLRRLGRYVAVAALVALFTGCSDAPQSALHPEGPIAERVDGLFRPVFWIAVAIFVLVQGLLLYAIIRFRDRGEAEAPKQVHGNFKLEFGWTLIPALILAGVAVPTVFTIFDLAEKATPEQLKIKAIGHQWWFEYRYEGFDPPILTANELVIPTNREVFLTLESADVVHAFWVPKLAGKQDMVPGRTNTLRLIADKEGTYAGQCAEFCAVSHANMRLRLHAVSPAEFDTWARKQQQPADEPTDAELIRGREIFKSNACVNCHAIEGVEGAAGLQGPNLTHYGSRTSLGAATYENTEENLIRWIRNAPAQKPGVIMPIFKGILTDEEIRLVARYLLSLK